MKKDVKIFITNNWDDDVASFLESRGFKVLQGNRAQGVSSDTREPIAVYDRGNSIHNESTSRVYGGWDSKTMANGNGKNAIQQVEQRTSNESSKGIQSNTSRINESGNRAELTKPIKTNIKKIQQLLI